MLTYARRAAAALLAVSALAMAACAPDGQSPAPGRSSASATADPVLGTWLDRRLLGLDTVLAESVPIVFGRGADGSIGARRPYTLHGESPCGAIAITVWPEATAPPAVPAGARTLRGALPAEAARAARFYLGEARYPGGCGYAGPLLVPTVVALSPREPPPPGTCGPGLMHWCTPDAVGAPVCTAHVRR